MKRVGAILIIGAVLTGCTVSASIKREAAPDAMNFNLAVEQLDKNDQQFAKIIALLDKRLGKLEGKK